MLSYWIGVLTVVGINLIAVLGVSILIGFTGLFSLGHAGFMAIGAYTSALAVMNLKMPIAVGVLLGAFVTMLVGIIVGYPALKLKGDYFLIATLGFGEVVRLIIENTTDLTGGARGLPDIPGGLTLPIVLVVDVLVIILLINFLRSRHGRNCIAIREDETAAESMGINVTRYKVVAMAISCALAGMSGALLAHHMKYLQPVVFSSVKSNELMITVVMGGLGSITGSTISNLILVTLPELLRTGYAQEWRMVIYGLIVVLIVVFKPTGLMGYREFSLKWIKPLASRIRNGLWRKEAKQ